MKTNKFNIGDRVVLHGREFRICEIKVLLNNIYYTVRATDGKEPYEMTGIFENEIGILN